MLKLRILVLTILVVLASLVAFAQTGAIQGTVTDKSGAVVQGANVTAKNLATNVTSTTTSGGTGVYSFPNLPVGHYGISVTKTGFKVYRLDDVELTVAQTLGVDASLEPGAVTEEVLVRASEVPPVDLETSQVSNLVDARQILDLPLITRDPYSLVLLSPGTSQTNTSLGGFTVNGSRERNNNFLLDGVDNNDTSVPGIPGGVLSANPDSTEEFRVITNNFSAEYGRNTGAIVDVVTKSGTNSFHGDVYEFGRWNGFGGARDWFNRAPAKMDPYTRNQFGYSVGGPIFKNKTFFFFNEEFQRFRTSLTNSATVPTHSFKTGVFTYTSPTGTQTAVDLRPTSNQNNFGLPLDSTVQQILALYPDAPSSSDGVAGTIFYPSSSRQNSYQTVAKIDHHFTDRESLSLRYGYDHSFDPDPFHDDILPGNIAATASKSINQGLSANLTSTLSTNLINSLTIGWNHIYATFNCTNRNGIDGVSPLDAFGNARDYAMDPFTSFGCLSLVSNGQWRKTGTTSYSDSLSWVRGNHTFKFGGDFRDISEQGPDSFFSRRQVGLNTFQVFGDPNAIGFNLINVPGVTDQSFGFTLSDAASALYGFVASDFNAEFFNKAAVRQGTDNKHFRQHEYDWFGQDTWKVRSNLTLTLGLRYQLDGVPYEEGANFSNLLTPPTAFPVVLSIVGPGTGKSIYQQDYSNIEPRIGFSWDPWHDGKTAVRGAFGIFHDRVFGNLFGNARGNPPFEQDWSTNPFETINNATGTGAFPVSVPNTTPSPIIPDFNGTIGGLAPVLFDTHFRNSSSNNWNFGIQRELPGQVTIDATYVGSKGTHIFHQMDGNPPDPALVQTLVDICSNPSDPRNTTGCVPSEVTGIFLYKGAQFGVLPFNAVAHNALTQPFYQVSNGDSIYHALQLKVSRRLSHGLQAQLSYTWAHALDDSQDPLVPAAGNRTFPRNSRNLAQDYGNSDNDIRQVAVVSYVWELPVGRGKSYLNSGFAGKLLEGMQFSGITTAQTGHPFEIRSTRDSQRTGIGAWATQVGNPSAPGTNDDPNNNNGNKVWFRNPDAFINPAFGGPGTVARNQYFGPGLVSFDAVFSKKMKVTERFNAELRVEGYNIFNHPHFTNPGADGGALGNRLFSGLFGLITSTASRGDATTSARQMQVALKLNF
jgi:hypothetical protein